MKHKPKYELWLAYAMLGITAFALLCTGVTLWYESYTDGKVRENCQGYLDLKYEDAYVVGVTKYDDRGLCCGDIGMWDIHNDLVIENHCALIAKGFGK